MRKFTLAFSTAALAFSGAAFAQSAHDGHRAPMTDMTRAQAQDRAIQMFAKMDANRDGTLNEADRAAHHAAMFTKLDTNRDGAISSAEFAARQAERGARGMAKARGDKPALTDAQKAERRTQMFARIDSDGNGSISRAEFDAMQAARMARGGGKRGTGKAMARMDGPVTQQAFVAKALARFDAADADRNGIVTVAERKAMRDTMRQQWQAKKAQREQG